MEESSEKHKIPMHIPLRDSGYIDNHLLRSFLGLISKEFSLSRDDTTIRINISKLYNIFQIDDKQNFEFSIQDLWHILEKINKKRLGIMATKVISSMDYPLDERIYDFNPNEFPNPDIYSINFEINRNKLVTTLRYFPYRLPPLGERQQMPIKTSLIKNIKKEIKDKSQIKITTSIENGIGFLIISEEKIQIGGENTEKFRLIMCLCEPYFGIGKTVETVFEAIRTERHQKKLDLNDSYLAPKNKITIIKTQFKEIQRILSQTRKKLKLRSGNKNVIKKLKIKLKFNGRTFWFKTI